MNRLLTFVALIVASGCGDLALTEPCDGISFDTVIFRDDFDTGPPGSIPDPTHWVVNHPDDRWWVLGRTFMPGATHHPSGPFPHVVAVENGRDNRACVIEHYHYNPYDISPSDPDGPTHVKTTFLGGAIHTVMAFEPTRCYRFEARVRWSQAPRGLVTSFFTYGYDVPDQDSDEIDLEYLGNEVFDPPRQVLTNTWDDSQDKPEQIVMPEAFDLTAWQTFRIYWCPGPCVKWTWIDPNTGDEILLRTETGPAYIPDEPMSLYFNFWAPTADWPKAYDASLKPDQQDNGVKYEYFIDYAEVRVP